MLEGGASQRHVARQLVVSQSVVARMWSRYQMHGDVIPRYRGGRQRATTQAQDCFIVVQARRHRYMNATAFQDELQNASGVRVLTQTIRNRLHSVGMRARRPPICIPLIRNHIPACLQWAQDHITWSLNDWTPVLFTDESRFCVYFTDKRARVWRITNERFAPVCIANHARYGGGSVIVWAGISMQGKTDLHIIDNGTMTAHIYVREVFDVYVRPYAGAIGPDFILMDDNARPHRAMVTNGYLQAETIVRMEWPARSPDLNPIEHVWDMLQVAISARPVKPITIQDQRQALLEEWVRIPQDSIRGLISSTRRRCQSVINANGNHTRY